MKKFISKILDISIKWKINFIGILIILIFSIILYIIVLPQLEHEKIKERKGKLRAVVNSMVSLMDHYERSIRQKKYLYDPYLPVDISHAKKLIIKNIRHMRYDKNEYFFILNGNGDMVMHPLKRDIEGQSMVNVMDPRGLKPFREMIINSQKNGEAYVNYIWQSKYSSEIFEPQTVYAKYFWPWDWVVCSGVYTQDIIDSVRDVTAKSFVVIIILAVVSMGMLFIIVYYTLDHPLAKLLSGIEEIHKGNLDFNVDVNTNDEIGYITGEFNTMVNDLKKNRDVIIKSEKRYRELTSILPDIIFETDLNLNIIYFNTAGVKLTGYNIKDYNDSLPIEVILKKDDLFKMQSLLNNSDDSVEKQILDTYRISKKDGGYFYGEMNSIVIFEGDRPMGIRGVIRDVTEKRSLEGKLLQSQKMESIGRLTGGIAHDFNNILGGIIGSVSLMEHDLNTKGVIEYEQLKKYLSTLQNSGKRATNMVQQILALSRKQNLTIENFDLNVILKNVYDICYNSFDRKIEINFKYYDDEAKADVDVTQFEQVVLNLCINARDAMTIMRNPEEERKGKLTVGIKKITADRFFKVKYPETIEGMEYWNVSVNDTGVGFSSEIREKIFDPFFTTKDKGMGTGLGLSMVYNILKQHNSIIDAYSHPGTGTVFNIFVPCVLNKHGTNRDIENKNTFLKGEGVILIVEDDPVIQKIAVKILKSSGYEVMIANNGEEGVSIFKEHNDKLALVLLDMVMPRMSGKDAFIEMKKISGDVKFVITSGFKNDSRIKDVLKMGAHAFIQKPYTLNELSRTVYELVMDDGKKNV